MLVIPPPPKKKFMGGGGCTNISVVTHAQKSEANWNRWTDRQKKSLVEAGGACAVCAVPKEVDQ